MTARELYDKLLWSTEKEYMAQLIPEHGLSVNIEDFFTKLVKNAARTNRFSSDIRYTFNEIEDQMKNFKDGDEWSPVFIGFRRDGVDGTSYVLSNMNQADGNTRIIYDRYFAFYGVDVVKEDEYTSFYKIKVHEYWT